eukprot:489883-Hanusia_phi.AAC.1
MQARSDKFLTITRRKVHAGKDQAPQYDSVSSVGVSGAPSRFLSDRATQLDDALSDEVCQESNEATCANGDEVCRPVFAPASQSVSAVPRSENRSCRGSYSSGEFDRTNNAIVDRLEISDLDLDDEAVGAAKRRREDSEMLQAQADSGVTTSNGEDVRMVNGTHGNDLSNSEDVEGLYICRTRCVDDCTCTAFNESHAGIQDRDVEEAGGHLEAHAGEAERDHCELMATGRRGGDITAGAGPQDPPRDLP